MTLLARFRPSTVLDVDHAPTRARRGCGVVDVGRVRVVVLDSHNPLGGAGGSIDSDQCAWLVRQLESAKDRYVVVASHDSSFTMVNRAVLSTMPPRVLGQEIAAILLAHANVVAWVSAQIPLLAEQRHGLAPRGFWELPAWASSDAFRQSAALELRREGLGSEREVVIRRFAHGAHPSDRAAEWRLRDPFAEGGGHSSSADSSRSREALTEYQAQLPLLSRLSRPASVSTRR